MRKSINLFAWLSPRSQILLNQDARDKERCRQQSEALALAAMRKMVAEGPNAWDRVESPYDPDLIFDKVILDRKGLGKKLGWLPGLWRKMAETSYSTLFPGKVTAIWDSDLFRGIVLSGAVRRQRGRHRWRIRPVGSRPELERDLEEISGAGIHCRIGNSTGPGKRRERWVSQFPLGELKPYDAMGIRALAGLLMGARVVSVDGIQWMMVPDRDEVRNLLARHGIISRGCRRDGVDRRLVSPFFGRILAHLMPRHSAGRLDGVGIAGDCPFIPVLYARLATDSKGESYGLMNRLPFGCSRATFFRLKLNRLDFAQLPVDMGLFISPEMRSEIVAYPDRATPSETPAPQAAAVA